MQVDNLSWFPGHMTKTRRMITAEIKNMDAVCEILDARFPCPAGTRMWTS